MIYMWRPFNSNIWVTMDRTISTGRLSLLYRSYTHSHYVSQCWFIANQSGTKPNLVCWKHNSEKFQWNSYNFMEENAFENAICILYQPQCVNLTWSLIHHAWPYYTLETQTRFLQPTRMPKNMYTNKPSISVAIKPIQWSTWCHWQINSLWAGDI